MDDMQNDKKPETNTPSPPGAGSRRANTGRDKDFCFCPVCGHAMVAATRDAICPQCQCRFCPLCSE